MEVVPQRTTIVEFEAPEELDTIDPDKGETPVEPAALWRTAEDYVVISDRFEPVEEVLPVDEAPQVAEMPDRVTLEGALKEKHTPADVVVEELDVTPYVLFTCRPKDITIFQVAQSQLEDIPTEYVTDLTSSVEEINEQPDKLLEMDAFERRPDGVLADATPPVLEDSKIVSLRTSPVVQDSSTPISLVTKMPSSQTLPENETDKVDDNQLRTDEMIPLRASMESIPVMEEIDEVIPMRAFTAMQPWFYEPPKRTSVISYKRQLQAIEGILNCWIENSVWLVEYSFCR